MEEENRYLTGAEEEYVEVPEESRGEDEVEYYELPEGGSRSMIWSVASLLASLLSVVICPVFYLAIALSVFAVVAALLSRKRFGYFDKMALFGLIVGIFGFVFGIFSMVMDMTGILDKLLGK